MSRPAVLIVDPEADRRRQLSHGLAEAGYEVVPASDAAEGRRFARGLGPAVIVAPAELEGFGDAAILDGLEAAEGKVPRTLVLLGESPAAAELPEEVAILRVAELSTDEVVRRLRLVLLARELGIETDARVEALVGDLAIKPLLALLRDLKRALVSGHLRFERGELFLEWGEVIAARCGPVRGLKAVGRLGRMSEEAFRLTLGPPGVEREIEEDHHGLVLRVIEDSIGELPDLRARLEVRLGPDFFEQRFDAVEQAILSAAHGGATVAEVLDEVAETDGAVVQGILHMKELGVLELKAAVAAVRVVTDSTCDLPADLAREHGLELVPLSVRFGERSYRDRVDLQPGEFYRLLEESADHPTSSPPPVEELAALYRGLLADSDVVSVHISSELSETAANARKAAERELKSAPGGGNGRTPRLEVVDSRQVSLGLGLLAIFAARMAARGEPAATIVERLEGMRGRIGLLFVVDSLDYLARGGRIGKARALMGKLLGIRPILGVVDGEVTAVERVRGGRAAQERLVALMREQLDPGRPVVLGLAHTQAPARADRLRRLIEADLEVGERWIAEIGPVVGTHCGPGTSGAAYFQPTPEEASWVAPLDGSEQPGR